jgi:hypothetical protein
MKKLDLTNIRPPKIYQRVRDEARARVIAHKRARRVSIGECLTVLFDDRMTMISQIEEMALAEHLEQPKQLQAELDIYNQQLPDAGELAATLFVDIEEEAQIRPTLERLAGLAGHVALTVGDVEVRAHFEGGREEDGRISAVQYLRFALPEAARRAIAVAGTKLALSSDLPSYPRRVELSDETRASLANDLADDPL